MGSYQKFLNDGMLTAMEKYSVINISGRTLLMGRQRDDATSALFSIERAPNKAMWSVSGAPSASVHDNSGAEQASSFW